jgi:hypothetical protein
MRLSIAPRIQKAKTMSYKLNIAIALAVLTCGLAAAQVNSAITGQWAIDGLPVADKVELTIHRRSADSNMTSSSALPLDQLRGLSAAQMNSSGTVVKFEIVREAGAIECEGYFKSGSGGGTFRFAANPKFPAAMESLGYAGISGNLMFHMAVHDVSTQYVRELRRLGAAPSSAEQLLAMRIHNVSVEYIEEMKSLGYASLSSDKLIAMRIHGVSPAFVREFQGLGYRPGADDLVTMRIHGVNGGFAKDLKGMGYEAVSVDQMVTMRIHGASAEFVKQVKGLGYDRVSIDQLVTMRIHGVSPEYIQGLRARGMRNLSIDELVSLRIHGIVD